MFFPIVLAVALSAKTTAVVEPPSNLFVSASQDVVIVQWNGKTNVDYQVESLDFTAPSANWEPIVVVSSSSTTNFTLTQPQTTSPTKLYRVAAVSGSGGILAGKPSYAITTSASPAGSGATGGGGSYAKNASATVTATATNSCYNFVNWTEGGTNVSSSANYTFTVTRNRTLVANFAAPAYMVTTSSSPSGGGTTSGDGTTNCGSSVTVTATPALCYSFVNWTENGTNVSTSASYTFTAGANRNLVANFSSGAVTVNASSSGNGTVGGGGSFTCGSSVTVTATPAACYTFVSWTEGGAVVSSSASYTFTANNSRTLVANFAPITYSIITGSLPSGGGTTSGGGTVNCGSSVTVTATPASCYSFVNWTEGATVVSTSASYTFTANASRTLVANFALTTYSITTSSSPSGGGATSGGGTKNCGSSVTVTATANSCYSFVNWTEGATIVSTSSSYTFTASGNRTLVANFALTTYSITASSSPSGGGTTSGDGTKNCGSSVTLTATPASCYSFVNWTESGTNVSSSASYTFTANANRTLVANFALTTYSVTTSSSPSGGGTTSGGGTVNCGSSVTVTATPNAGYNFTNWTEGGTQVSASASYTFTASGSRALVANFTATSSGGGITNNLTGYWTFDAANVSGTTALDSSGNTNHGTLQGTVLPTIVNGKIAQAVNLDGVSGLVNVPNSTSLNITGPFTVAAWVNFNALPSPGKYPSVVAKLTSPSGYYGYGLFWNGSGVSGIIGPGSAQWYIPSPHTPTVGAWNHYAAVFDGTYLKLYVNGVFYSQVAAAAPGNTTGVPVKIGPHYSNPGSYGYLNGMVDDSRIYNRALGAADVTQLYNYTGSTGCTYTVSTSSSPSGGGTTSGGGTVTCGSSVTVTATPASCYSFVNWTEGATVVSTSASYTFTANASRTLVANFALTTYSVTTSSSPSGGGSTSGGGTVNCGSSVTVTATPASCYSFVNWTEGATVVSTSASYTFTANASRTLVANFALTTYSVTTSSSPSGGGTTTGGGTKNCGSSVTVTATPASCYSFVNWTEGATVVSTSASYTFTASASRTLVANFALTTYSVTTSSSPSGGGTTSGGGTVNCGSSVTVTATPASCYSFVNWTEGATVVSTSASYTFTASASRTLVANFALTTYSIATSSSPSGGGSTSGGGTKNCGSSVTVTATPASCYSFVNWTEGATVVSTSASYTFTASASRTLVANFALTTYSIATSSSPSGGGSTSGGGTKNCGSSVTVTATPASCYSFVNWTEGATVVSTSASYTFTASASRTLVANFALTTYFIGTSSSPSSGGTTSGGGTKNCGSSVTVVATTNAGFNFVNWTESGSNVSASASYTFTAGANRTLVANFTPVGNIPPVAVPGTNQSVAIGANASFIGGNSYDPDGTITNYTWAFGDGMSASGMNVSHAYTNAGTYAATLTVKDNLGATGTSNAIVTVTNAPPPVTPGELLWVRASSAQPGPNAVQLAVGSDPSGNGVAVGWFSGTVDFGTGPISTTSTLDTDGFIVKRDSQGNPLWTKRLGTDAADAVNGVVIDSQGNIIVTGHFTTSSDGVTGVDFGGTTLTSVPGGANVPDIFVAKYSPSGSLLWVKGFGGAYDDRGIAVAVDGSNNVVIASEIKSINASFGGITLSSMGNYDVVLAKLSGATGSTVWAVSFGTTGVDLPSAVVVDRFGDVVVTGSFAGGSMAKRSGVDGSFMWVKATGGAGNGVATDPATGNIFVTGGNAGIYLSAYDPSGQTNLWTKTTGSGTDSGTAVAVDANGNLVLTGKAADAINFGTWPQNPWMYGNGQPNVFVAAFTVSGNSPPTYRWTKVTGASSTGSSGGTGIALDSLGHVLVGGFFTATVDFGGISATTTGGYNAAFLAQYSK